MVTHLIPPHYLAQLAYLSLSRLFIREKANFALVLVNIDFRTEWIISIRSLVSNANSIIDSVVNTN